MTTQHLPIEAVRPNPNQPRKKFNAETLKELAQSIKEHGLIEPVIVEEHESGYMLVAGERRLRASKLAGMTTIEAVIRPSSNHGGREILLSAIIENVQREDMNPIDEARSYGELIHNHQMTARAVSLKVGKSLKYIYDRTDLLKLEVSTQDLIRDGKLHTDSRMVRALLALNKADQVELAKRAAEKNLHIKAIISAAQHLGEIRGSKIIRKNTPGLYLARRDEDDEERKPANWGVFEQLGKLPAWTMVVESAKTTCAECELRDMANSATCGRCPLVGVITSLMEKAS